jgi:hypothetical protein
MHVGHPSQGYIYDGSSCIYMSPIAPPPFPGPHVYSGVDLATGRLCTGAHSPLAPTVPEVAADSTDHCAEKTGLRFTPMRACTRCAEGGFPMQKISMDVKTDARNICIWSTFILRGLWSGSPVFHVKLLLDARINSVYLRLFFLLIGKCKRLPRYIILSGHNRIPMQT